MHFVCHHSLCKAEVLGAFVSRSVTQHCQFMFIIKHLIVTDEDYDKTESPDDLVKVLVNPMIGEVFKVRRT